MSQLSQSEFTPHAARSHPSTSVSREILRRLTQPERRPASIYVFDRPSSPGILKIGITAHSVSSRLQEWSKQCGYTPNLLFSAEHVPHAKRIESLLHLELREERRREGMCRGCGRRHSEWFEISEEQAEEVMGGWADFMERAEPYDSDGSLKDKWREVVEMMEANGEEITAKALMEHHKKSILKETTLLEESTDLGRTPVIGEQGEGEEEGEGREGGGFGHISKAADHDPNPYQNDDMASAIGHGKVHFPEQLTSGVDRQGLLSYSGLHTDSGDASLNRRISQPVRADNRTSLQEIEDDQSASTYDTKTVYSDGGSVETSRRDEFIQEFTEILSNDIGGSQPDTVSVSILCNGIQELLADFALRLGHESSSIEFRRVMVFIHRYRSSISAAFEQMVSGVPDEEIGNAVSTDKMPMGELMQMWFDKDVETKEPIISTPEIEELPSGEFDDASPELGNYRNLILSTSSYQWLVATIRNKLLLATPNGDVKSSIRAEVLKALPKPRLILQAAPTPLVEATFDMDLKLNLADFESKPIELGAIVTVTGTANDAQALTCNEYMRQTWPVTGIFLIRFLADVLMLESGRTTKLRRLDGTNMKAMRDNSTIKVTVSGTRDVVAEIAEQLCWVTAALGSSPTGGRLMSCSPSIHYVGETKNSMGRGKIAAKLGTLTSEKAATLSEDGYDDSSLASQAGSKDELYGNISVQFKIALDYHQLAENTASGSCWHYLFKRCLIVQGFPIRQRPTHSLGIEIPLNIAAELIDTKYLQDFAGHSFLKGFSMMLAPAKRVDNLLIWHLCRSTTEDPVSYLDHGIYQLCDIDNDDLARCRHIVGWCSNVMNTCGAADSDYNIMKSILEKVPSDGVLHNCEISFGRSPIGGVDYTLSANHVPTFARGTSLGLMFRYLGDQFVLFWDTGSLRGWLVNGLRCLLHLLRLSLKIDDEEDEGELFVLRSGDLKEPEPPFSARKFLCPRNLSTKLMLSRIRFGTEEYEVLSDRVEQFYYVMEKSFICQKQHEAWDKIPRSQLEGWDFFSIARKDDPIKPSMFKLPPRGKSWVDFVRAIGAVTFFGEGFGEILKPKAPTCSPLPCSKYYIAITTSDMKQLMAMNGCDLTSTTRMISQSPSIMWYSPSGSLEPRGCETNELKPDNDIVQVMWLKEFASLLPKSGEIPNLQKYENGAIIFGHNDSIQYYAADFGPPVPVVPIGPAREPEPCEDTSTGSSLSETAVVSSSIPTALSLHDFPMATSTTSESLGQSYESIDGGHATHRSRDLEPERTKLFKSESIRESTSRDRMTRRWPEHWTNDSKFMLSNFDSIPTKLS
ncbi:uncharacterized protein A1O5_10993 [Cladophialophora psammophila CBS 110553]|uniref:Bacteriophage T5 Orf172 DNA-binding domain-containing protein n=1 Tax=Cladophialophora psammophila CBS 110553 TaxID=1182543 RepID=W9WN10_9EURO|nr:uncharacterized protein A1O5_10993 [Cladophialophora psammophila CBS 110553]EXJ66016.1 hypothetical protein A1O5_10993 [Cladophialophora psammophila CBS 110553]